MTTTTLGLSGRIEFTGKTLADVEDAIGEALRRISGGSTSGFDRNTNGSFAFDIDGVETESDAEPLAEQDTEAQDTEGPVLVWESAGTDNPGDQNADSRCVGHGYWALGPDHPEGWSVELIAQDEDLHELPGDSVHLGRFPTSEAAKAAAADYETQHRLPRN